LLSLAELPFFQGKDFYKVKIPRTLDRSLLGCVGAGMREGEKEGKKKERETRGLVMRGT